MIRFRTGSIRHHFSLPASQVIALCRPSYISLRPRGRESRDCVLKCAAAAAACQSECFSNFSMRLEALRCALRLSPFHLPLLSSGRKVSLAIAVAIAVKCANKC